MTEGTGWAGEEEGKGEGKGTVGEVEGRKREGPKLLLNQGPSEPCYATVSNHPELPGDMVTKTSLVCKQADTV